VLNHEFNDISFSHGGMGKWLELRYIRYFVYVERLLLRAVRIDKKSRFLRSLRRKSAENTHLPTN